MDEQAIKTMIEAALKPLYDKLTELEIQIDTLDHNTPDVDHYHDMYASCDHVERADDHLRSDLYRLREDLSNLEYRLNDVDRTARDAQRTADDARRNTRGGW